MLSILKVSTRFDINNLIVYDIEFKQKAFRIPVLELEFQRWHKNDERVNFLNERTLHIVRENRKSYAYVSIREKKIAELVIDNCGDLIRLYE